MLTEGYIDNTKIENSSAKTAWMAGIGHGQWECHHLRISAAGLFRMLSKVDFSGRAWQNLGQLKCARLYRYTKCACKTYVMWLRCMVVASQAIPSGLSSGPWIAYREWCIENLFVFCSPARVRGPGMMGWEYVSAWVRQDPGLQNRFFVCVRHGVWAHRTRTWMC